MKKLYGRCKRKTVSDSGSGDEKMLAQMAESDIVETLVDNAIAVQNLEKMAKLKTAGMFLGTTG